MSDSIFDKIRPFWQPLAIALAVVFVYAAVLLKLGGDLWHDKNYSHGLIVPFVILYILWLEADNLKNTRREKNVWAGGILILAALGMLLAGTLGSELFTQRISLTLMIAGLILYFFGSKILRKLSIPFALFLLSIPIPQLVFNKIAIPLQLWASQAATWGIRFFEIPTIRNGNVIELLPQGATQRVALEVVEACSGIRSLMTLVTLALVLGYFTRERRARFTEKLFSFLKNPDFWRTAILMLSAIPIAILTNAARVSGTGILTYYYGKQVAEGFWHELSGWLVFVAALALLIGINWILKKVQNAKFKTNNSEIVNQEAEFSIYDLRVSNYQTALILTVLLIGGIFINWLHSREELLPAHRSLQEFSAQIGDWRQKGSDTRFSEITESILGANDYIMRDYISPAGRRANLYIGFYNSQRSGATYHSPQNCMPGSGWEMKEPELVEIKTPSGKVFKANQYIVQSGEYREVLIYWYQGRGRETASEYRDKVYTVLDSIFKRRTDGAMVRLMTPIGKNENESLQAAADLAAQTADLLPPFVPE